MLWSVELLESVVIGSGWHVIQQAGIIKILIALFASPVIGFIFGYLIIKIGHIIMLERYTKGEYYF